MTFPTEKPGYAEKVLTLRYRIMEQLKSSQVLSDTSTESAAACLNLINDVDALNELLEQLKKPKGKIAPLKAISSCLSRQKYRISASGNRIASLTTSEGVPLINDPCVLERRLEQTLLLINEGCVLLTLADRDEILKRAAQITCKLLSCDEAMAVVVEGKEQNNVGACGCKERNLEVILPETHAPFRPINTGEPFIAEDIRSLPEAERVPLDRTSIRSLISVPLVFAGRPSGVIIAGYYHRKKVDAGDVEMLQALSKQVSFTSGNLVLQERVRKLDLLQERRRIAQDLHDTVIQLLFVIGMEAEEIARHWPDGSNDKESILRIRRIASRATEEMRSAISALSMRVDHGNTPLSELLQGLTEEVESISDLQVTLVVPPEWPKILPEASRAAYRIIREALTNVQKHANATAAIVSIATRPDKLIISVQDNGVGFPNNAHLMDVEDTHFGFRSMHHLAEQAGGYLEALNGEDGGAVVRFVLPLTQ